MKKTYRYGELPWRCIQQRYNKRAKETAQTLRRWEALNKSTKKPRRTCDWELQIEWGTKQ